MTQIKQDIDNLEYRSRCLNLEIHGIPASENEDLMAKVNEIAMKLQVPTVTRNDITNVHRLRAKVGKTPGVIVRFQNQEMRDKWLSKKKLLNHGTDNLYVCENMTRHSRNLLTMAKEWAAVSGYAFVWHVNGKVLVRRANGESAAVVRGKEDLARLRSSNLSMQ